MSKGLITTFQGKLILFGTILASGMAFLDGTVVNIAVPVIQAKLHASLIDIQWVVNSYALMLAALILISGSLGDKFGRKRIFLYGIGLFIFASFLCGLSQNILQLILLRGLQGIGAAMMVPGSLSIINTAFEEKTRGRAIGLWSGFAGGVAALGPFLGGFLVQLFGWQSIFYINIPIGLLAIFIIIKYVPESKNANLKKLDYYGTATVFLGLLGIVYALMNQPVLGWQNIQIWGSLSIGILFTLLFIFIETKATHPLMPLEIFKSNLVTGANIATLFLYFALSGVVFFLVLNFQQVQRYPPLLAGLGMLPTILLITFLSGQGGTIADKIGPRTPMVVGPLIVAVGMASFMIAGRNANYFLYFLPGQILFGLGMALVIAPLTKSALAVKPEYSGSASGVNNAVARIAGLLAVALLGGVILSQFSLKLSSTMQKENMSPVKLHNILNQKDALGAIEIPKNFNIVENQHARLAIDESFIYGFRWIMGINAFLALLSSIASFVFIYNSKTK